MPSTPLWPVGYVLYVLLLSASVEAREHHCDRSKRYDALSVQSQQDLHQGLLVNEMPSNTRSASHLGYMYKLVAHSPEMVMAVFTSYAEQKTYITNVREATVEVQSANYARVRLVYDLPWPLPRSEYVVNDTVVQEGDTYLLYWDLHPSSPAGMSAPKYVEGYFRTQPVGPHTLIVYCNYVIPVTGWFPGMVKREGRKAMQTTLHDIVRWVETIATTPAASGQRIARLRAMLAR